VRTQPPDMRVYRIIKCHEGVLCSGYSKVVFTLYYRAKRSELISTSFFDKLCILRGVLVQRSTMSANMRLCRFRGVDLVVVVLIF